MQSKTYRFNWLGFLLNLAIPAFFAATAIGFEIESIQRGNGPTALSILFALIFMTWTLVILVIGIQCMSMVVSVDDEGLRYHDIGAKYLFRWEEIETVIACRVRYEENFIPLELYHYYELVRRDGLRIKLRRYTGKLEELGQIIVNETVRRQLPVGVKTIQSGQVIEFRHWRLTNTGITCQDKYLPWNEVSRMVLWSSLWRLHKKGSAAPFATISMATPNSFLMASLIEHLKR